MESLKKLESDYVDLSDVFSFLRFKSINDLINSLFIEFFFILLYIKEEMI